MLTTLHWNMLWGSNLHQPLLLRWAFQWYPFCRVLDELKICRNLMKTKGYSPSVFAENQLVWRDAHNSSLEHAMRLKLAPATPFEMGFPVISFLYSFGEVENWPILKPWTITHGFYRKSASLVSCWQLITGTCYEVQTCTSHSFWDGLSSDILFVNFWIRSKIGRFWKNQRTIVHVFFPKIWLVWSWCSQLLTGTYYEAQTCTSHSFWDGLSSDILFINFWISQNLSKFDENHV